MTGLLVSVRSATEAQTALRAGADLIDVKEPSRGALGRADAAVCREVVEVVGRRRPVSVALGDLPELATENLRMPAGVSYAKIGLANCVHDSDWYTSWRQAVRQLPASVDPVAVAYADWQLAHSPPPINILRRACEVGCRAILLDTFDKSEGDLLEHFSFDELVNWVGSARENGLLVVLAGSLDHCSLPTVLKTEPDFVGVRGAVCRNGRNGAIDERQARNLVAAVSCHTSKQRRRTCTDVLPAISAKSR